VESGQADSAESFTEVDEGEFAISVLTPRDRGEWVDQADDDWMRVQALRCVTQPSPGL
jgi:hypothetical protein